MISLSMMIIGIIQPQKDGSSRKKIHKDFMYKLAFIFIFAISACCHSRAYSLDDFSTPIADADHTTQ
jgi:hypothetical protein